MEFLNIFTEMNWISAMLLIIGAVFVTIEVFVPNFGFFGVTGMLALIAGVVVRIVQGLNLTQSLVLILIVIGFVAISVLKLLFSANFGLMGWAGFFEKKSTLSVNYNKPDKEIKKLIGKSGKAVTDLNLAGVAKIKGKLYNVQSVSSYINEGANIKVVAIENNEIKVRKWFE